MPSRKKKQEDPWWFSPSIWDVIPNAKVLRQFNYALLLKIISAFTKAQYPTRPKRAKCDWMEPVCLDGTTYQLSGHIDENNKKIVMTNIKAPKEMKKRRRHK